MNYIFHRARGLVSCRAEFFVSLLVQRREHLCKSAWPPLLLLPSPSAPSSGYLENRLFISALAELPKTILLLLILIIDHLKPIKSYVWVLTISRPPIFTNKELNTQKVKNMPISQEEEQTQYSRTQPSPSSIQKPSSSITPVSQIQGNTSQILPLAIRFFRWIAVENRSLLMSSLVNCQKIRQVPYTDSRLNFATLSRYWFIL